MLRVCDQVSTPFKEHGHAWEGRVTLHNNDAQVAVGPELCSFYDEGRRNAGIERLALVEFEALAVNLRRLRGILSKFV